MPIRALKSNKNNVDATLNVKVAIVRPVCSGLRSRSFTGKL
jgi:hypothetical protein